MPTLTEIADLEQERDDLAHKARGILDAAQERPEDKRDLSTEEEQEFDRLMDRVDGLDKRIAREKRAREAERAAAERDPAPAEEPPGTPEEPDKARMRAFNRFLSYGLDVLSPQERDGLTAGKDTEGGFLVAPQEFVEELIQAVDDDVPLRPLATVMTLTEADSLGVPSLDTDLDDAEWTVELATGSQDDAMRFGKREFRPNPVAKRVKVSRTLLRKSSLDPEAIVRQRLGYKFSVTAEKAYMTGDGNKKPLGLFVASADGISTARDVNSGNNTDLTADGLIDAKYALKAQYHRRARWLFHRFAIRNARKLKDLNNQYLWQPGLAGDRPDTLLDIPYVISEFAPNTFTQNSYIGLLGDFSFYWIADALDMEIRRLEELYAETNQVGFIGRLESDGMPVLEEAFVRIKLAA